VIKTIETWRRGVNFATLRLLKGEFCDRGKGDVAFALAVHVLA
jgi:hypothetical protein